MNRRQFLPSMLGFGIFFVLEWLRTRPANATFLNDWMDSLSGSPASNPVAPAASVTPSDFQKFYIEIYGNNYITRDQLALLQNGSATHWWDIVNEGQKPYGRLKADDDLEHYYFPFSFGDGGVILVSDSTGAIVHWDVSGAGLAPPFQPADLSEYVYFPPREVAVADPAYPPPPPQAECYYP
ncbi:MAG: hypothetical protein HC781_01645 [Leptolyngbyaceae cyanobacterium CSU_1_4]|nr:hypothetical protein [Leptolyngbyaceae cyanobacterium CSU_1_4]